MAEIDCTNRSVREINAEIRLLAAAGEPEINVRNPAARHNLGVAVLHPVRIRFGGSVGYFCGGMIDGAQLEIEGSAGWGLAESMLAGEVVVRKSAGNGAAAAIRGGTVVIHGDAAARLGVSMKGGLVIVAGNCGYMAGFMAQKGTMIICGDAGEAFGDSMYETVCYVGGSIADLGTDAKEADASEQDARFIDAALAQYLTLDERRLKPPGGRFRKIIAGRKLWNFDKREKVWQEAL